MCMRPHVVLCCVDTPAAVTSLPRMTFLLTGVSLGLHEYVSQLFHDICYCVCVSVCEGALFGLLSKLNVTVVPEQMFPVTRF